ncbi:MAG: hypothetical protein A2X48_12300 [Lentisphaerae bacterium GWF2_49_21]|nr:MAG: hypothetical protein A2X48_12300 [Lentisphaerae bacterium GWF2_49_21]
MKTHVIILFLLAASQVTFSDEPAFSPKSMAYVLQADKLSPDRKTAVKTLKECHRDLIVIDASYESGSGNEGRWTKDEISEIRSGAADRKVVAYISIGEAEDYRSYWKKDWDANKDGKPDKGAPDFLDQVNPDWAGNYKVRYWKADWQKIILDEIGRIIDQGFDGIYLDIVDGFEFFEYDKIKKDWQDGKKNPDTGKSYREDMIAWVEKIAEFARKVKKEFIVIPQNGSQLLKNPEFVRTISAIGIEDLFTEGNKIRKPSDAKDRIDNLSEMKKAGKPVLLIEYGKNEKAREASRKGAAKNGLILLITDRELATPGEAVHENSKTR